MPLFGRYREPLGPLTLLHLSAGKTGRMLGPWETSSLWGLPLSRPQSIFTGNGDILSFEDANCAMQTGVAGVMIAR